MWKDRYVHRSFQYVPARKGTGRKIVQPDLGASGKRSGVRAGYRESGEGIILSAGRLRTEVPSNEREVSAGGTQACRAETEKVYSKSS